MYQDPTKNLPPELIFFDEHETSIIVKRKVSTLRADRLRGGGIPFIKFKASVRYRLSDIIAHTQARVCTSTSQVGK